MDASMLFKSMHFVIILMRLFMDFIMGASMLFDSMHWVIILMRSFMELIMDAFIGMAFIE
jgi:hypothetical protein